MNRLKELRKAKGMTMRAVARELGMPYTTYVNYEKGVREPNSETLIILADYYRTTIDYILGKAFVPSSYPVTQNSDLPSNILPMPQTRRVPRIGQIACGTPITAEENFDGYDEVPDWVHCDFTLTCKGDSMINARIYDGDIVCIRRQDTVETGEIAAVLVENEATLKRVHLFDDHIVLEAENPTFRPLVYWGSEMANIHIIGKATHFISTVR